MKRIVLPLIPTLLLAPTARCQSQKGVWDARTQGASSNTSGGLGFVIEGKLGRTCMDVSASELLWQFFRNHGRR